MTAGSPKPESDDSLADGASEAEAARKVDFEKAPDAGPHRRKELDADERPDAGDPQGGAPGKGDGPPAPDAIAVEELTTENDDGAA